MREAEYGQLQLLRLAEILDKYYDPSASLLSFSKQPESDVVGGGPLTHQPSTLGPGEVAPGEPPNLPFRLLIRGRAPRSRKRRRLTR